MSACGRCASGATPSAPAPGKCKPKPRFDVLAHHPINTSGPPRQSAINRDDISTPDLPALQRVLRRAPGGPRPLWVTEFWWSSKPPSKFGYKPAVQARYIAESLYLFWKAGAEVAINLKIRDGDSSSELPGTGLYYLNGKPKPAARAFSFPFVADGGKGKAAGLGQGAGRGPGRDREPWQGRLAADRDGPRGRERDLRRPGQWAAGRSCGRRRGENGASHGRCAERIHRFGVSNTCRACVVEGKPISFTTGGN